MPLIDSLRREKSIYVRQMFEAAELFGFETRNKYKLETAQGVPIGFAAEQQKGVGGFLFRQFVGHWRSFEISIFDENRMLALRAWHPFRFFFKRIEVFTADGRPVGAIQQRFSILSKRFDVEGPSANVIMSVNSPFWHIWKFTFEKQGRIVAILRKKWTGLLAETFTDKDQFRLDFEDPSLTDGERQLLLACALFVDLRYFETKAERSLMGSSIPTFSD